MQTQGQRRGRQGEEQRAPRPRESRPGGARTGAAGPTRSAVRGPGRAPTDARAPAPAAGRCGGPAWPARPASTVSEPSTATATTMIEPAASEANTASRATNRPEHRDDHRDSRHDDRMSRCLGGQFDRVEVRPTAGAFFAGPLDVEERIVHPDGHAHQQDHARRRARIGQNVRRERGQAGRRTDRRQRQQYRHPGRDDRPERDQQDDQRHRQAVFGGGAQVVADLVVYALVQRRRADLFDSQRRVVALHGRGRVAAAWRPGPTRFRGRRSSSRRRAAPTRPSIGRARRPTPRRPVTAVGWSTAVAALLRERGCRAARPRAVMSTSSTAGSATPASCMICAALPGLADAGVEIGHLRATPRRCRSRCRRPRTPARARSPATGARRSSGRSGPSAVGELTRRFAIGAVEVLAHSTPS